MNIYPERNLFLPLNTTLNKIHSWSSPEQNPMKRMFATRLYGIVCAVMEVSILLFKSLKTCETSIKFLGKLPYVLKEKKTLGPSLLEIRTQVFETGKYVFGFASSVFFGIIFSPEINFKIHLNLETAIQYNKVMQDFDLESLSIRADHSQKVNELQKTEMAKLQLEQNIEEALQSKQREIQIIQSRLAELLS